MSQNSRSIRRTVDSDDDSVNAAEDDGDEQEEEEEEEVELLEVSDEEEYDDEDLYQDDEDADLEDLDIETHLNALSVQNKELKDMVYHLLRDADRHDRRGYLRMWGDPSSSSSSSSSSVVAGRELYCRTQGISQGRTLLVWYQSIDDLTPMGAVCLHKATVRDVGVTRSGAQPFDASSPAPSTSSNPDSSNGNSESDRFFAVEAATAADIIIYVNKGDKKGNLLGSLLGSKEKEKDDTSDSRARTLRFEAVDRESKLSWMSVLTTLTRTRRTMELNASSDTLDVQALMASLRSAGDAAAANNDASLLLHQNTITQFRAAVYPEEVKLAPTLGVGASPHIDTPALDDDVGAAAAPAAVKQKKKVKVVKVRKKKTTSSTGTGTGTRTGSRPPPSSSGSSSNLKRRSVVGTSAAALSAARAASKSKLTSKSTSNLMSSSSSSLKRGDKAGTTKTTKKKSVSTKKAVTKKTRAAPVPTSTTQDSGGTAVVNATAPAATTAATAAVASNTAAAAAVVVAVSPAEMALKDMKPLPLNDLADLRSISPASSNKSQEDANAGDRPRGREKEKGEVKPSRRVSVGKVASTSALKKRASKVSEKKEKDKDKDKDKVPPADKDRKSKKTVGTKKKPTTKSSSSKSKALSVYDTAFSTAQGRMRLSRLQACMRGFIARRRWRAIHALYTNSKFAEPLQRRTHILHEIVSSEAAFVQQLETAVKLYLRPIRELEQSHALPQGCVRNVFANLESLYEVHRHFLAGLNKAFARFPGPVRFGEVFLSLNPQLNIHGQYTVNYEHALDSLHQLQGEVALRQTLADPRWMVKLSNLLIAPIQRIPRYVLLLRDLVRHTPNDHVEYGQLQKAVVAIGQTADFINETKRLNDSKNRVKVLEKELKGAIQLMPVLKSGWLWKRSKTLKQWRRRYAICEGPVLLFHHSLQHNMKAKGVFDLHGCRVQIEAVDGMDPSAAAAAAAAAAGGGSGTADGKQGDDSSAGGLDAKAAAKQALKEKMKGVGSIPRNRFVIIFREDANGPSRSQDTLTCAADTREDMVEWIQRIALAAVISANPMYTQLAVSHRRVIQEGSLGLVHQAGRSADVTFQQVDSSSFHCVLFNDIFVYALNTSEGLQYKGVLHLANVESVEDSADALNVLLRQYEQEQDSPLPWGADKTTEEVLRKATRQDDVGGAADDYYDDEDGAENSISQSDIIFADKGSARAKSHKDYGPGSSRFSVTRTGGAAQPSVRGGVKGGSVSAAGVGADTLHSFRVKTADDVLTCYAPSSKAKSQWIAVFCSVIRDFARMMSFKGGVENKEHAEKVLGDMERGVTAAQQEQALLQARLSQLTEKRFALEDLYLDNKRKLVEAIRAKEKAKAEEAGANGAGSSSGGNSKPAHTTATTMWEYNIQRAEEDKTEVDQETERVSAALTAVNHRLAKLMQFKNEISEYVSGMLALKHSSAFGFGSGGGGGIDGVGVGTPVNNKDSSATGSGSGSVVSRTGMLQELGRSSEVVSSQQQPLPHGSWMT